MVAPDLRPAPSLPVPSAPAPTPAAAAPAPAAPRVPGRLLAAIAFGTLLNPLNSSMIAVALTALGARFAVDLGTVTWLISSFYLVAAVGQPLMGRLADLFGPRRVFTGGLVLVCLTSLATPWAPGFWALVALRALQALGTSAAYPSGLAMIRAALEARYGPAAARSPAAALGVLGITANVSAGLGPALGGLLLVAAGWPAIFLVNVPLTLAGLLLSRRWLPADPPRPAGSASTLLASVDLAGILLFSGTLTGLLGFLLSLDAAPLWLLLPAAIGAGLLLIRQEQRVRVPFLDIRMLAANRRLLSVYAQFATLNVVFYAVFFGLPLWLEQARGFPADAAGLLLLPLAGLGVLTTPLAARALPRVEARTMLLLGTLGLTAGVGLLFLLSGATPTGGILVVTALLGIPNAFNNLALQAALYEAAPPGAMGAAAGQFQTFRYVGSILATSLLGAVFGAEVTDTGLHRATVVLIALAAGLTISAWLTRRPAGHPIAAHR